LAALDKREGAQNFLPFCPRRTSASVRQTVAQAVADRPAAVRETRQPCYFLHKSALDAGVPPEEAPIPTRPLPQGGARLAQTLRQPCRFRRPPHTATDASNKGTTMTIGTVKFYNSAKGFGFIAPQDGGKDVFVHATALEAAGMSSLSEGQKVSFDVQPDPKGSKAVNLQNA
jgi:CspA family cold shock protein